jgi:hypothetical protein
MGWLHVLFAHADPQVYIDITIEHQKRTDEAESELAQLRTQLATAKQDNQQFEANFAKRESHWIGENAAQAAELAALRVTNARLSAPAMSDEQIEAANKREGSSAADFAISFMERNNPPTPAPGASGGTK